MNKAEALAKRMKQQQVYEGWKRNMLEMKRIRSDRILWQAHTTNDEFFAVGITMSSQMN
jgi:hypothetical protein